MFKIARRVGVPVNGTMKVIGLNWKDIEHAKDTPNGCMANARLAAQGFTEPDLVDMCATSPTLSKAGRHALCQLAASNYCVLEVGDYSTAFLQGD